MRILITGASGFVGQHLKPHLAEHELIELTSKHGSIEAPGYFDAVPNPQRVDLVFHLAGLTFVPESWEKPLDFTRINSLGTQNTLEFCRKNECDLIYVSSYMYGKPEYLPIDESHPVKVVNPYAFSKWMGEEMCRFYGANFGVKFNILRLFNLYGPGQNPDFLIPHIINQLLSGSEIKVRDLEPKRDYIHIDDFVDGLLAASQYMTNSVYNLGSGHSYSVQDIIDECQNILGKNLPVISEETTRKNEIPETVADISRMKSQFNWEPKTSLRKGLAGLIRQSS